MIEDFLYHSSNKYYRGTTIIGFIFKSNANLDLDLRLVLIIQNFSNLSLSTC